MDHSLSPRVWLVTGTYTSAYLYISNKTDDVVPGTSSGFGKHFVLSALARGDRVIAAARSLKKLEAFTSTINAKDLKRLRPLQLDLTDGIDEVERKIAHAFTFWNQIDVLVNNAGESSASPFRRSWTDINAFQVASQEVWWKKEGEYDPRPTFDIDKLTLPPLGVNFCDNSLIPTCLVLST